jgi:hypothetical protein
MWIKEPTYPLGESSSSNLNFLYNHEKFYFMDNHLAASWCWLQKIDVENSYNLFHIDKHYDLLDQQTTVQTQIIDANINLTTVTLEQYRAIQQPMGNGQNVPLFRFDNYILNLNQVYPDIFALKYFATHNDGNRVNEFINSDMEIIDLPENLNYWMSTNIIHRWILNLDIDYFFHYNDSTYQLLTDFYIKRICKEIHESLDNIEVITIALSPEICGGWKFSYRIARMIANYFDLDFRLTIY